MNRKGIKYKLSKMILSIALVIIMILSLVAFAVMINMEKNTLETTSESVADQITELAKNKAVIADSMLDVAQRQTIMIAEGVENVLKNSDKYLLGYDESALPNLSNADKSTIGKYSVYARVPENLLMDIKKDDKGTVIDATINRDAKLSGPYTVNQELYLMSLLNNDFAQIKRFISDDGSYEGFAASYFCFEDSGIDVLGELLTTEMICYDARERAWYQGAKKAWENGTLNADGVYWSEPVLDGSGRGISMICAVPVIVDGKFVGVAGSGGLLINFTKLIQESNIGNTGFSFMINRLNTKIIINPNSSAESELAQDKNLIESDNVQLSEIGQIVKNGQSGFSNNITIDGKEYMLTYYSLAKNNWTMAIAIEKTDELITKAYNELNIRIRYTFLTFLVIVIVLIGIIYVASSGLAATFTNPIIKLKNGVKQIGTGDLNQLITINTGDEIEDLGTEFNKMAKSLDDYIKNLAKVTAEKERIGAELNVATRIQADMLPSEFPPFPDKTSFDIYASMNPAKEVGGDFYDFFMIDEDHLGLVIADVSGKGVPAALFMVIAKSLIKNNAMLGNSPKTVLEQVNDQLCYNNTSSMFVTVWFGVLEISTGKVTAVNAGHEYPSIKRANGKFELLKDKHGLAVAAMEGAPYKEYEFVLEKGSTLFVYTDGVAEATDKSDELFGTDRMLTALNKDPEAAPEVIIKNVSDGINEFVKDAEQFDDITMLSLKYNG